MSAPRVAVVDYGAANRTSVLIALERAGAAPFLASDASSIARADAVVLPGVANTAFILREAERLRLRTAIVDATSNGTPVLGICAGFQILCEASDEAPGERGLARFDGTVTALAGERRQHVGWSRVASDDPLLPSGWAYFTHGYALARSSAAIATTTFGAQSFVAAARAGSTIGVQFHPERSGAYGNAFLRAFLTLTGVPNAC